MTQQTLKILGRNTLQPIIKPLKRFSKQSIVKAFEEYKKAHNILDESEIWLYHYKTDHFESSTQDVITEFMCDNTYWMADAVEYMFGSFIKHATLTSRSNSAVMVRILLSADWFKAVGYWEDPVKLMTDSLNFQFDHYGMYTSEEKIKFLEKYKSTFI